MESPCFLDRRRKPGPIDGFETVLVEEWRSTLSLTTRSQPRVRYRSEQPLVEIHRVVDGGITRSSLERKHPDVNTVVRIDVDIGALVFVPHLLLVD